MATCPHCMKEVDCCADRCPYCTSKLKPLTWLGAIGKALGWIIGWIIILLIILWMVSYV